MIYKVPSNPNHSMTHGLDQVANQVEFSGTLVVRNEKLLMLLTENLWGVT